MSSKSRIEVYIDCNSPYSFFALTYLLRNKAALAEHGVAVDINPFFLGGINVGSGNKPPWTLPAKARYSPLDTARAARYFNVKPMTPPPFFPILSILPMRAMLYIKRNHPEDLYHEIFLGLWQSLWREHLDISKPDVFAETLKRHFPEGREGEEKIREIIEATRTKEMKDLLTGETERLVGEGAFGAPWYFVTDREGKRENFFGSDRFPYMLQYLGVPFRDLEIIPPGKPKM